MTTLTPEGARLQEALDNPDIIGWYGSMGDPLYALESSGAIVVYGSSDLGLTCRIIVREHRDQWDNPEGVEAIDTLAEALEPMLEEASNSAEDANLENADPYKRAGAVACEWMLRNGLGRWDYTVEYGWSRGARVSIKRVN